MEVVISAAGPKSAEKRLDVVKQLLGPDLIDQELAKGLVAHGVGQGHDQNRKDLIKMLLEFHDRREEVLLLWNIAFRGTSLENNIKDIQTVLGISSAGKLAEGCTMTPASEED